MVGCSSKRYYTSSDDALSILHVPRPALPPSVSFETHIDVSNCIPFSVKRREFSTSNSVRWSTDMVGFVGPMYLRYTDGRDF